MEQTERNESATSNRRLTRMFALVPSVPEIRYLLGRLVTTPPVKRPFIMAWSIWRRRHQAKAAEAHYRKRLKTQL